MDRLEAIKVPEDIKNYKNIYKTNYDELFEQEIISRGRSYYYNNKVVDFKYENNICEAVVESSNNYTVIIKFKEENIDQVYCSCLCHESNTYCKHIYAVLLFKKMQEERNFLIKQYNNNYNRIKKISNDIKIITDDNEQYLTLFAKSWANSLPKFYDQYLNELKEKHNIKSDINLISSVKDSYYYLNNVINDYNQLLDYIEDGEMETLKGENKGLDISAIHTLDDNVVFKYIDENLANLDASQLKYLKKKFEENTEETEIIDKALKERIKREKIAEEIRRKQEKRDRKQMRKAMFWGIISGLSSKTPKKSSQIDLMPWEQDEINKENYESFNFEEQELEEDDFYHDNLD